MMSERLKNEKNMRRQSDSRYRVIENTKIARKTWRLVLDGDTSTLTRPGQFVNVGIPGKFLRRPISVSDYVEGRIVLLYDVVGEGTREMSEWVPGREVDMLSGLGDGFDPDACREGTPLLLGGGIGCAPLVGLARALMSRGKRPVAVLGFNSAEDVSVADVLEQMGVETHVATVDGTRGTRGFVTDAAKALDRDFSYVYACGPTPMLKAVCQAFAGIDGEVSLESRMGCGFGACMCCSIELKSGPARICKEGPVFKISEITWK